MSESTLYLFLQYTVLHYSGLNLTRIVRDKDRPDGSVALDKIIGNRMNEGAF